MAPDNYQPIFLSCGNKIGAGQLGPPPGLLRRPSPSPHLNDNERRLVPFSPAENPSPLGRHSCSWGSRRQRPLPGALPPTAGGLFRLSPHRPLNPGPLNPHSLPLQHLPHPPSPRSRETQQPWRNILRPHCWPRPSGCPCVLPGSSPNWVLRPPLPCPLGPELKDLLDRTHRKESPDPGQLVPQRGTLPPRGPQWQRPGLLDAPCCCQLEQTGRSAWAGRSVCSSSGQKRTPCLHPSLDTSVGAVWHP